MPIPKKPILANPDTPIVGVPGPDGVLTTAVPPRQEPLPVPSAPLPLGPQSSPAAAEGILDPTTPEGFAAFVEQTSGPAVPPRAPSAEERILGRQEAATAPSAFGQFAPEDLAERADVAAGGFGAAFSAGFSEGLLGWLFRASPGSARDRDKATAELVNYAAQNPWSATLGQIAGGFASDLPLEVVLGLGTLGVGEGIILAARASGRGAASLRRMAAGVQNLKRAYRLDAGKSLSREGFRRAMLRGAFETGLGAVAGLSSEAIQQGLGKQGDATDIIERAVYDALASGPFAETLRFGAKGLRLTKRAVARSLAKDIKADNPELRARDIDGAVQRGVDDAELEAELRAEDIQALNRSIDADEQITMTRRESAEAARAINRFNRRRTPANLERAVAEMIEDPDPTVRRVEARRVVDVARRRARAAGMTLEDYLNTKRVRLAAQNQPSQIITNTNNIIAAPTRATTVPEFFHEIGHLVFADLNDAHRNAFRKAFGIRPDRQLAREDYEQFADAFTDFLTKGTAKNREVKRMFQRVAEWIRNVYRRLTNRPPAEDIDDLFRKIIPEDSVRVEEPIAVPTVARERLEARVRSEAGLQQLFAPSRRRKKSKAEPSAEEQAKREKVQEAQEAIAKRGNEAAEKLEESEFIPRTKAAKFWNKVQRSLQRLLYSDNISLNSFLDRLGPGFRALKQQLQDSVQESARLHTKMRSTLERAVDDAGITPDDTAKLYRSKRTVELDTKEGKIEIELEGHEALKLTMYALDGFDQSRSADKVTRNSAQQALTASKAGFLDPKTGKKIVLTEEGLKKVQSGALLQGKEQQIMDVIFKTYRSVKPDANKVGGRLIGQDLMSTANDFYNPKHTDASSLSDDLWAVGAALVGDKKARTLLGEGNLRSRSGAASLRLVDPLAEVGGYINRMSDVLAKAETMASMKITMDKSGARIEALFGESLRRSLDDLIRVNTGDTSMLGAFTEGSVVNRVFSANMIGKLALNPSVALKQFASSYTAAATGKVRSSGFVMGQDAGRLASDSNLRKAVVDEIAEHNPIMARRLREEPQFIEVERAVEGMGSLQLFHGKLPMKTMLAMAKKGDVKKLDVIVDLVRRGTIGIRIMDESTLGAIWRAVKKDVLDEGRLETGSPAFWREVNKRWNDILLESQPTIDPAARSINQLKRGIAHRFLTMYSTQTRKNWELMDKTVAKYLNIERPTADDKAELIRVIAPLAYQTAYVTAVGLAWGFAFNKALGILQSEKRRKQIEQRQASLTVDIFSDSMTNLLGQRPIVGKIAADFANAMLGEKPFQQAFPILDDFTKIQEGVAQRSIRRFMDGTQQLIGVPSIIRRPASELGGKLQE